MTSVVVKQFPINMFQILNSYRHTAVWMYCTCTVLNSYRHTAAWMYMHYTNAMWMVVMKEKLITVSFILILMEILKDKFCYTEMNNLLQFTINVPKYPPPTSVHFATRLRRSRVVRLSRSSLYFMQSSSIQNANQQFLSTIQPLFFKLRTSPNPTNKNLTEFGLNIQTALTW